MPKAIPVVLLIAAAVLAAIAGGLWTVGGPNAGQQERRDAERRSALLSMARNVECIVAKEEVKPEYPQVSPLCTQSFDSNDPLSGEAYEFEFLSETEFRLCAQFERPGSAALGSFTASNPPRYCLHRQID